MLPRCSDSASFQFVLASNCCSGSHRAPDKWANQSKTKRANQQKNNCARPTETACCDERDLYAGTATRHLYRLNADTGSVLSDLPTESEPRGHLIVAGAALIVFLGDEILASFDVPLNKLKWSAEASKMWTSARPYLWRGVVLAGNRRELVAFRSSDGVRQWSYQFPETVRGIGTSDEILYVGTLKGPIFAYSPNP